MPKTAGLWARACGHEALGAADAWIGGAHHRSAASTSHPTAFALLSSKAWNEDSGQSWVKEEEILNLGPDADVLPLCEDLNSETVGNGDSCWSTCEGQCPNDVLQKGLVFDFDEVSPGHPGCTSHFECVGNKDRVLCHAVPEIEADAAPALLLTGPPIELRATAGIATSARYCHTRNRRRARSIEDPSPRVMQTPTSAADFL
mmetsp:Transcript_46413/g.110578  ORF Transcript_46413/g.110578 Transcript_46413/m.110578 type:complete len:202 (+) Transcript_46413:123-728(+)